MLTVGAEYLRCKDREPEKRSYARKLCSRGAQQSSVGGSLEAKFLVVSTMNGRAGALRELAQGDSPRSWPDIPHTGARPFIDRFTSMTVAMLTPPVLAVLADPDVDRCSLHLRDDLVDRQGVH